MRQNASSGDQQSQDPQQRWWQVALRRVEPGQQPEKVPKAVRIWTSQTFTAMTIASLFGGYRGLVLARSKIPSPVPAKSPLHRSTIFFVRESILTSAKVGLFVATFSSLALSIEHMRKTDDAINCAVAGGVTCGLFGGSVGGWFGFFPSAAFGTVLGGAGAMAQSALQRIVDDAMPQRVDDAALREQNVKESIDSLINRFESQLQNHPSRLPQTDRNAEKTSEGNGDSNNPSSQPETNKI